MPKTTQSRACSSPAVFLCLINLALEDRPFSLMHFYHCSLLYSVQPWKRSVRSCTCSQSCMFVLCRLVGTWIMHVVLVSFLNSLFFPSLSYFYCLSSLRNILSMSVSESAVVFNLISLISNLEIQKTKYKAAKRDKHSDKAVQISIFYQILKNKMFWFSLHLHVDPDRCGKTQLHTLFWQWH